MLSQDKIFNILNVVNSGQMLLKLSGQITQNKKFSIAWKSKAVLELSPGSPGIKINSHESHFHDYESYEVFAFSKSGKKNIW